MMSTLLQLVRDDDRQQPGDIIPASWPPIISEGLFRRVQDRMKSRQVPQSSKRWPRKRGERKDGHREVRSFTFRNLLWCSECDRRFVSQSSHVGHGREGSVVYYFCGSRETTTPCEQGIHAIREEMLLPWVDDLIAGFEKGRMGGVQVGKKPPLIPKETAAGAIKNPTLSSLVPTRDSRWGASTSQPLGVSSNALETSGPSTQPSLWMSPKRPSWRALRQSGSPATRLGVGRS
jgi:hypothetical protein